MSRTFDLLDGLNPPQQEAVRHIDGPLLVLAGPGSGKTRVVTHRIAWLLRYGVRGGNILALTFTNKAADEMKQRLESLAPGSSVWIGTFHKFCSWTLRQYPQCVGLDPHYSIYDTNESKKLLDTVLGQTRLPAGINSGQIASAISWAKNSLTLPSQYVARQGSMLGSIVEDIYPAYQEALKRANAVDFDDLLLHVAVMLRTHPEVRETLDARFRYILIDEYQDTNLAQYAIARATSINYRNLAVTGDPDQSIYGWRGANIQNILNFEKDFEDVRLIRLEQNYRSTKRILRAASELIKYNVQRKKKELFTENPDGAPVRVVRCFNQQEEAESIAEEIAREIAAGKRRPKDYAVFYRMNALSRNLEHALRRHNVPFQLVRGLEFFNRKEIKDIVAYLQLLYNHNDTVAFLRIINEPRRGIGQTTLERIGKHAFQTGVSHLDAARDANRIPQLSAKVRKATLDFVNLFDYLGRIDDGKIETLISAVLSETQYDAQFANSDNEEDQQRLANIEELLSEAKEFDRQFQGENSLETFLEQIALASDVDAWDDDSDRVSLMTLHAAKGLEFPVVYLVAAEEGMLPHERSSNDPTQLEEERRLFFVGITRAEQELRLSRTQYREFRGSYNVGILSRFLLELPQDEILRCESPAEIPDEQTMQELIKYGTPDAGGISLHIDPNDNDSELSDSADETPNETYIDEEYEDLPTIDAIDELDETNESEKIEEENETPDVGETLEWDEEYRNDVRRREKKQKPKSEMKFHLTTAAELQQRLQQREQTQRQTPPSVPSTSHKPQTAKPSEKQQSESTIKTKTTAKPKRPKYKMGMPVRHKDYGIGVVLSVTDGDEKTVTIDFEETVGVLQLPLPCRLLKPLENDFGDIF
ncbi:MAG: UvrD-helicase domain-containing protein [Planctomycetaceae bacterium]|jgi:DNA helicase-2/ATP-dependent DNA helicase PcrA|nr:UvrD-helicase domain-containing protein [Planctomycetaceae bacterium]